MSKALVVMAPIVFPTRLVFPTSLWVALAASSTNGHAEEAGGSAPEETQRQSLEDAWWTGPIVAAGAGTLPQGHALVEPYLFDVIRYARFDRDGKKRDASRVHGYGSLTYMLYGVTDAFTVGLIPTFGFNEVSEGSDSSRVQFGDLTLQAQYRLSQFREGSRVPTSSIVIQQTLPTGKYDRLGTHPSDALGLGAHTTTVAVYSQYYLWMPNGRITRTRFNVSYAFSDDVRVRDVSVYGTEAGFRGVAKPGDVLTINSSWEYSITRNWVFALDFVYQHDDNTFLLGSVPDSQEIREDFGSAWRFGIAPAIEYNWSGRLGLIVGARWFGAGNNTSATVTPAIALNMVF
jgi:hypothetical protein